MVHVELIYVAHDQQMVHIPLTLEPCATVLDALQKSNIFILHPETKAFPVGIYAKRVSFETVLKEGDRVEIYRPLALDPKEKRRKLARLKK